MLQSQQNPQGGSSQLPRAVRHVGIKECLTDISVSQTVPTWAAPSLFILYHNTEVHLLLAEKPI